MSKEIQEMGEQVVKTKGKGQKRIALAFCDHITVILDNDISVYVFLAMVSFTQHIYSTSTILMQWLLSSLRMAVLFTA